MKRDYSSWANRRAGKGMNGSPNRSNSPQAEEPGALPPPPPGYGWVHNPQYGWMAVPLAGASYATSPPMTSYSQVPQNPPANPMAAYRPSPPAETCALVKPGPEHDYLANVRELAPPSGWDAMSGNPDPAVLQEVQNIPEFRDLGTGADHNAPTRAYPTGRQFVTKIGNLKS